MLKKIGPIVIIYLCACIAWFILGGVTAARTHNQDAKLRETVGQLWGTAQSQKAPTAYFQPAKKGPARPKGQTKNPYKEPYKEQAGKTAPSQAKVDRPGPNVGVHSVTLGSSDITVDLKLDHRKKGLLWYSTYQVAFAGEYVVTNDTKQSGDIVFSYAFPTSRGIYDDFTFAVDGKKIKELQPSNGIITRSISCGPGESKAVKIAYKSHGMDEWRYVFGAGVSQIRDFKLAMTTDFADIDFPEDSISPTNKEKTGDGWKLAWEYSNLISGIQIGMDAPQKLNPGPFASKISFFAPVSLFLFLFLMFMITTIRQIKLHPMNYFFISAAFFSFHLLMAYLIDHINVHLAFAICSTVSIFLVISYMRLVVGARFALIETGLSQVVYLVLFSYVFFLEGYTGLAITIGCVITLFVVMQFTGRIDWDEQFSSLSAKGPPDLPQDSSETD